MRLFSFLASLACLGDIAKAAGKVEFDLVYPRDNQSYAPTAHMPVVFAVQNPRLAQQIYPYIAFRVQSLADPSDGPGTTYNLTRQLNWANVNLTSNEPYFVYTFVNDFSKENKWAIWWSMNWTSCEQDHDGVFHGEITTNLSTTTFISVITKNDAQPVDLIAANDQPCHKLPAYAIDNISDESLQVADPSKHGMKTCVVVPAEGAQLPTREFCSVKFNAAIATNVSADLKLCGGSANCPSEPSTTNAAQRLAGAGAMCLAVAFGAFGMVLA